MKKRLRIVNAEPLPIWLQGICLLSQGGFDEYGEEGVAEDGGMEAVPEEPVVGIGAR